MAEIYLDHQASTSLARNVLDEMIPFLSATYANPHSDDHAAGWAAAAAIEASRERVAASMAAETDEIYFTAGATEANNIAILGAAEAVMDRPGRIVVSAIDHKSVLAPARSLARRGFEIVLSPVDRQGLVDLEALAALVGEGTVLVSVGAVNNEVGTVQPIAEIASIVRSRSAALFHTDATQCLAWNHLDVAAMGVDLASVSSHKVGGPKGIGALFMARHAAHRVLPILHGGGQESGLRPGTLPTPLCVGFGAACAILPSIERVETWSRLTGDLLAGLRHAIPGLRLNGADAPRHPGNLNVMLTGIEGDALLARLQPNLAISLGSACTSGIPEPSHVLTAMGLSASEMHASVRISTSPDTTRAEVVEAVELIATAAAFDDVLRAAI